MASAAGLRRVVLEFGPAHTGRAGGGSGGNLVIGEDSGLLKIVGVDPQTINAGPTATGPAATGMQRGRSIMQLWSKPLSLCNQMCVLGAVTLASFALLAVRLAFSSSFTFDDNLVTVVNDLGHLRYESTGNRMQLRETETIGPTDPIALAIDTDDPNLRRNRPKPRIFARNSSKILGGSRNCINIGADKGIKDSLGTVRQAYKSPVMFYENFMEMACKFKVFVYPADTKGKFSKIFQAYKKEPAGNYASEHYFKMGLMNSSFVTTDPAEADLFYMPFSIAEMRNHPQVGTKGIRHFVRDYVEDIRNKYPYWNRTDGADHFYVNCHSIGRTATDEAPHVRFNAIQVVCSSSYFLQPFFPHKDATIPQIWPRSGIPKEAASIKQRKTLAFFAGAANSPVRAEVAKYWSNDSEIRVYTSRIDTPYDQALLKSKFCLHVRGFEVNTARLADAMFYGCVPIIIAAYHDLPFNDVLDWRQISVVIPEADIPKMKKILKRITPSQYAQMQRNVMQVRRHFQWHFPAKPFDAFYMVMYELWLRRHLVRHPLAVDE